MAANLTAHSVAAPALSDPTSAYPQNYTPPMTGAEIPLVAKTALVATEAGAKALEEQPKTNEVLLELAKDDPAMKAAARSFAHRVAIRQGALERLYTPLRWFAGFRRDYFDNQFTQDMAMHTEDIPEDSLVTPPAQIAIPAMEGLAYSLDEPELKEMYLNLLARASDSRPHSQPHPGFAQIIKELSPKEAALLKDVLPHAWQGVPIVRLGLRSPNRVENVMATNLIELLPDDTMNFLAESPAWIDNWVRLGLVAIDYSRRLPGDGRYDWVTQRLEYERVALLANTVAGQRISIDYGIMLATSFGKQFLTVVIGPNKPAVGGSTTSAPAAK